LRESGHNFPGGTEKNALAFADREVKASNHTEGNLLVFQSELSASRGGEGHLLGLKDSGVDSGMDDMKLSGIDPAGVAVMAFGDGGGRVVVPFSQHLGDKFGDGDDRIGVGEEMISAKRGAGAFGQMPGEDDQGGGLNEAGGEEGGPIVVPVVGVKDAGTGNSKKPG